MKKTVTGKEVLHVRRTGDFEELEGVLGHWRVREPTGGGGEGGSLRDENSRDRECELCPNGTNLHQ